MTCEKIQNRILVQPDPRDLPENLRAHVIECPACTAWWKQAIQIDAVVAELPVPAPPAEKKTALLEELRAAEPVIHPVPLAERPRSSLAILLTRPSVKYTTALAASVIVAVGGWLAFRSTEQPGGVVAAPPAHPLLGTVKDRIVALSSARSQPERMEILGDLAGDLSLESRNLARIAGEDELRDLSGWFKYVVDDGLVKQAEKIPPNSMTRTDRKVLLDKLTAKLAEAEREADRIAREAPPHAQVELRKIANTARDGQDRLKKIFSREEA
jgi:hypothetical protein